MVFRWIKLVPSLAGHTIDASKSIVYYTIVAALTYSLILWISIFMYGTFYFAFIPTPEHQGPLYPIFQPCQETPNKCGFLNASVEFSKRDPVLMTGQAYSVSVILEMPESPVNRNHGMFMNCIKLKSVDGTIVRNQCKSSMLVYRSELLRIMETFVFSPLLLSGYNAEKQQVEIVFFDDFQDDPMKPAVELDLEIMSRFIEIYSVRYQIRANFGGLRYMMIFYPLTSALVGIAINMTFLCTIILLSWYRFFAGLDQEHEENETNEWANDMKNHEEVEVETVPAVSVKKVLDEDEEKGKMKGLEDKIEILEEKEESFEDLAGPDPSNVDKDKHGLEEFKPESLEE